MGIGLCYLCDKQCELIRAHIYPKCFLRFGKEKNDELIVFGDKHSKLDKTHPNGIWDSGILCRKCDSILGDYDKYAKEVLLDKDWSTYLEKNNDLPHYVIPKTECNCKKIRKFLIATLWRASISKIELLKNFSLGRKYNNLCKEYLKDEIDDIQEIDIILLKLTTNDPNVNDKAIKALSTLFVPDRIDGIRAYKCWFGGYEIYYKVDQQKFREDLNCITSNCDRLIIPLQDRKGTWLKKYFNLANKCR